MNPERKFNVYIARKSERMALYGITEETRFIGTDNEKTYYVCPHCLFGWLTLQDAQSCVMNCELEKGTYVKGRRTRKKNILTATA